MPATRSRRSSKADQDRAQREAAAAAKSDEASAEELAAQKDRPSNEADGSDTPDVDDNPTDEPTADDEPQVGALVSTKSANGGGSKKDPVWVERLNTAAKTLADAGYPEGQGVVMLVCATPKTAANTANGVRNKISEGAYTNLAEDVTFEVMSRSRAILARAVPIPVPDAEQPKA